MSVSRIRELREKRAKCISDARAISERVGANAMSAEDQAAFDAAFSAAEKLAKEIQREERLLEAERSAAAGFEAGPRQPAGEDRAEAGDQRPHASEEYAAEFGRYLRHPGMNRSAGAMNTGSGPDGGYLLAPVQMVSEFIHDLTEDVFMRQICRVTQIEGAASGLGYPTIESDPGDAEWTAEVQDSDISVSSGPTLGRRELKPHLLSVAVALSDRLVRKAPSASALVSERLREKFSQIEENAFLNGDGAAKPLGVFTASAAGISTARDVSTGNTATSPTLDGLLNAMYHCKARHRRNLSWVGSRDFYRKIATIKDGEGRYIWLSNVREGAPDTLFGRPAYESEFAPATFTGGLYVAVCGDFRYYAIADDLAMQIRALDELKALQNKIVYHAKKETDGMPIMETAFARVKLG